MNATEFKQAWDELRAYKAFEVPMVELSTGNDEYILFGIELRGEKFVAEHVSLTWAQKSSPKISFVSIDIDYDFSIDSHLQELYGECINAIIMSDFYKLKDDE